MKCSGHNGEAAIYRTVTAESSGFCIQSGVILQCETMTAKRTPQGVQVLHKTIDILDALRHAPEGMSLAGLATHSGMPKPTVYRILVTLASRGYLERAADSSYRISRKLFEEPRDSAFEQRLVRAARPAMEKLAALCKETLNLGVLDGGEVLVIETVESRQAVRMTSKIGNRRYPHSTGLGKILLSDLQEREVLRLIRSKGMPRFTPATIVREKDLVVELERVRAQGYAVDNMENELDGRCIAAPIMDAQRKVIAALSISGPLPRMTMTRAKAMVKELTATCKAIGSACS
jgi:DNA-binding IclR family transcriptional regulator